MKNEIHFSSDLAKALESDCRVADLVWTICIMVRTAIMFSTFWVYHDHIAFMYEAGHSRFSSHDESFLRVGLQLHVVSSFFEGHVPSPETVTKDEYFLLCIQHMLKNLHFGLAVQSLVSFITSSDKLARSLEAESKFSDANLHKDKIDEFYQKWNSHLDKEDNVVKAKKKRVFRNHRNNTWYITQEKNKKELESDSSTKDFSMDHPEDNGESNKDGKTGMEISTKASESDDSTIGCKIVAEMNEKIQCDDESYSNSDNEDTVDDSLSISLSDVEIADLHESNRGVVCGDTAVSFKSSLPFRAFRDRKPINYAAGYEDASDSSSQGSNQELEEMMDEISE